MRTSANSPFASTASAFRKQALKSPTQLLGWGLALAWFLTAQLHAQTFGDGLGKPGVAVSMPSLNIEPNTGEMPTISIVVPNVFPESTTPQPPVGVDIESPLIFDADQIATIAARQSTLARLLCRQANRLQESDKGFCCLTTQPNSQPISWPCKVVGRLNNQLTKP